MQNAMTMLKVWSSKLFSHLKSRILQKHQALVFLEKDNYYQIKDDAKGVLPFNKMEHENLINLLITIGGDGTVL